MKTLKDIEPGTTVTVRKVSGGSKEETRMEGLGILRGSDLTLLEVTQPEGMLRVRTDRQELLLAPEDGALIAVGAQFKREGDPVLMSGCCANGDTFAMMDRMEKKCCKEEK